MRLRFGLPGIMVALLIVSLSITGCQSTGALHLGKMVEPLHVIPLTASVANEQWTTNDLNINYSCTENGKTFRINGQVVMSDHYREIYYTLERLDVTRLFLDHNATVIKSESLANAFAARTDEPVPFTKNVQIPQNASAFSFAYLGTARKIDQRARESSVFHHAPK